VKVRIEKNSIRLRLRKSELEVLHSGAAIGETLHFSPDNKLQFELIISKKSMTIESFFEDKKVLVSLPFEQFLTWYESQQVSIDFTTDSQMYVLIEKDFPCKDRPEEDQSDTFFELVPDEKKVNC
jgi:hypothetical protein